MTTITEFDRVTVGKKFPVCFTVNAPGTISCLFAEVYLYSLQAAQLLLKNTRLALFLFEYGEEKIVPDEWKDAQVLWEYENPRGFENL
jgi:hypothetical protein